LENKKLSGQKKSVRIWKLIAIFLRVSTICVYNYKALQKKLNKKDANGDYMFNNGKFPENTNKGNAIDIINNFKISLISVTRQYVDERSFKQRRQFRRRFLPRIR